MADSSYKCTAEGVGEDIVGGSVVEAFPWTLVDLEDNRLQFRRAHLTEIGSFWEEVTDQAIDLFVGAPLPGRMRMSEIDVHRLVLTEVSMRGHFRTVIERDGEAEGSGNPAE